MSQATLEQVINDIRAERARQDAKWGADRDQPHTLWHTIFSEEVGEVAQAALNVTFPPTDDGRPRLEDLKHLYTELVQSAAVATAHAEATLRQLARLKSQHAPETAETPEYGELGATNSPPNAKTS